MDEGRSSQGERSSNGVVDDRRRFRVALVGALVAHAAAVVSFLELPAVRVSARAPVVSAPIADVEIELSEPPAPLAVERPTAPAEAPGLSASPIARRPARAPVPTSQAASELAASEPGGTAALESSEPAQAPVERRPGLSLEQLGLGAENAFVERRGESRQGRARELSQRVDRVLTDGIAKSDQRRGLGPEGPLLASLEAEARRSVTPGGSTALFRLSTDGTGALVGVEVLDANSDRREWEKLGERVLSRHGKQRLRGAHGARGLTFEIRLTSRVALPSGRDPGLRVDLFNLPVKEGSGKRSTRVSIVDVVPKYSLEDVKLEDGRVVQVPVIRQTTLGVDGDPVDIGAPAQRMVHARLERVWAN